MEVGKSARCCQCAERYPISETDAAMNMHVGVREFEPSPAKAGFLRRMLAFLAQLLASPKGYQGGWEGGARGL